MAVLRTFEMWRRALLHLLQVLARPIRGPQAARDLVLKASRGYGSRSEVFLIGRVFRQSERRSTTPAPDSLIEQFREVRRRVARRAVPGKRVVAQFYGAQERVITDQDGYFRIHLQPRDRPAPDRVWHEIDLHVEDDPSVQAQGSIFIPPEHCAFVVISDIDDTIMETGVANKLKMLWRLFVEDAESRVPFLGVAALYRALHAGVSGDQANPMLYVSRAPWGIYDVLDTFFAQHRIPAGPVLFLREWGVSWAWPFPRKAEDHKRDLINSMLALYKDLPAILIGDSGQHDPEIYRQTVLEHPGRIRAVYIRNVSRRAERIGEIEELARAVVAAGSSLVLAVDSLVIAEHAAKLGLIAPEAVSSVRGDVARDRVEESNVPPSSPAQRVEPEDLGRVLGAGPEPASANVEVEPGPDRHTLAQPSSGGTPG